MTYFLSDPDEVAESFSSKDVLVFSKLYPQKDLNEKYLTVVVKVLNGSGFILTSYRSNRLKGGNVIWKKR